MNAASAQRGASFARFPVLMACCAAFLLATALCGCAAGGAAAKQSMTLMVYLAGSSLESEAQAATADLNDMMESLPDDGSLNVIVLASGAKQWHSTVAADQTNIYQLTPEGLQTLETHELQSMGDPDTLRRLLAYAPEHFPADQYALVFWDHGAGPMAGVCFDELFQDGTEMDGLTLPELQSALADSPFAQQKLAWIGFDACLMASLETAVVVEPYAEYLIASQETEPTNGWGYGFLATVAGESPLETAAHIAAEYEEDCAGLLADVTLSCVDLAQVPRVTQELDTLFGGLEVTTDNYADFAAARSQARSIASSKPYQYDLVDVRDLAQVYNDNQLADTAPLLAALSDAVVLNTSNHPGRNGLSLYYPFRNKTRYATPWAATSRALPVAPGYQAFIDSVAAMWMGEQLANWLTPHALEQAEGDPNQLTLQLDSDQAAQLQSARLVVVKEQMPGEFTFIYASDEVTVTPQGVVWCEYQNDALYLVDAEGIPKTGALYYEREDDALVLPAELYGLGENSSIGLHRAYLVYRQDEKDAWQLVEVLDRDESGVRTGRPTRALEDFDVLALAVHSRVPTLGDGEAYVAFADWDNGGTISGYEVDPKDPGSIEFLHAQDSGRHFAFFELTDYQGNVTCSELYELPNENNLNVWSGNTVVVDNEVVTVTLTGVNIVAGSDPGLEIDFTATNHTNQKVRLQMGNYRFDEVVYDGAFWGAFSDLGPGETRSSRISLYDYKLSGLGITYVDTLSCDVRCMDENGETLITQSARFPLNVDLRAILG